MAERMAGVLAARGAERALIVHGDDGLDELTIATTSQVVELRDGRVIDTVETSATSRRQLARMMVGRDVVERIDKPPVTPGRTILEVRDLTALNDRLALIDAQAAVQAAFADRKLTEAQREWALGYAKDNPTGFAAFVAKAPQSVPAGAPPVDLKDTADDTLALTDDALGRYFDRTPSLAAEGFTKASYTAFRKADAAGLVKIHNQTAKE
jgi:hypothetical protein